MVEARNFLFSRPVQTSPGAHPAPCIMDTAVLSRGQSRRGVALTTHASSAEVSMSRATPLLPPLSACMKCYGETLTLRTVSWRRYGKTRSKWKYKEIVAFRPWPRFRIFEMACISQISGAKTGKLCYLTICFILICSSISSHRCFTHTLNKETWFNGSVSAVKRVWTQEFMRMCVCDTKKI